MARSRAAAKRIMQQMQQKEKKEKMLKVMQRLVNGGVSVGDNTCMEIRAGYDYNIFKSIVEMVEDYTGMDEAISLATCREVDKYIDKTVTSTPAEVKRLFREGDIRGAYTELDERRIRKLFERVEGVVATNAKKLYLGYLLYRDGETQSDDEELDLCNKAVHLALKSEMERKIGEEGKIKIGMDEASKDDTELSGFYEKQYVKTYQDGQSYEKMMESVVDIKIRKMLELGRATDEKEEVLEYLGKLGEDKLEKYRDGEDGIDYITKRLMDSFRGRTIKRILERELKDEREKVKVREAKLKEQLKTEREHVKSIKKEKLAVEKALKLNKKEEVKQDTQKEKELELRVEELLGELSKKEDELKSVQEKQKESGKKEESTPKDYKETIRELEIRVKSFDSIMDNMMVLQQENNILKKLVDTGVAQDEKDTKKGE